MAKKRNQPKKHRFKYVEPGTEIGTDANEAVPSTGLNQSAVTSPTRGVLGGRADQVRNFDYVLVDLRAISIFAIVLILAELFLWFLFGHTGLGSAVYRMVAV